METFEKHGCMLGFGQQSVYEEIIYLSAKFFCQIYFVTNNG